jgi:hypothetical protein
MEMVSDSYLTLVSIYNNSSGLLVSAVPIGWESVAAPSFLPPWEVVELLVGLRLSSWLRIV